MLISYFIERSVARWNFLERVLRRCEAVEVLLDS